MDTIGIIVCLIIFIAVWNAIFGKDSFLGLFCFGGLFYGVSHGLKAVGLDPQISNYVSTFGFLVVMVWVHIHDRELRVEIEARQINQKENRERNMQMLDDAMKGKENEDL